MTVASPGALTDYPGAVEPRITGTGFDRDSWVHVDHVRHIDVLIARLGNRRCVLGIRAIHGLIWLAIIGIALFVISSIGAGAAHRSVH